MTFLASSYLREKTNCAKERIFEKMSAKKFFIEIIYHKNIVTTRGTYCRFSILATKSSLFDMLLPVAALKKKIKICWS